MRRVVEESAGKDSRELSIIRNKTQGAGTMAVSAQDNRRLLRYYLWSLRSKRSNLNRLEANRLLSDLNGRLRFRLIIHRHNGSRHLWQLLQKAHHQGI